MSKKRNMSHKTGYVFDLTKLVDVLDSRRNRILSSSMAELYRLGYSEAISMVLDLVVDTSSDVYLPLEIPVAV